MTEVKFYDYFFMTSGTPVMAPTRTIGYQMEIN